MKFILATSLLLSATSVVDAQFGAIPTCEKQSTCLQVTANEIQARCNSHSCEYEICWEQRAGQVNVCDRYGMIDYVGDMASGFVDDGDACRNAPNDQGKGYWDDTCTDPEGVYDVGFEDEPSFLARFRRVCQVVPPGHTAHLLISDQGACAGEGQIGDATLRGLTAYCRPSSSEAGTVTGPTYFPGDDPADGGTCSDADEGYDCVWSITAPTYCAYEENDPTCYNNLNADTLCEAGSVLEYYEHDGNDPPPTDVIHDIKLNGDGTVSFKVLNPFVDDNGVEDFTDMYTVFDNAESEVIECNEELAAGACASDIEMTARCRNDGEFAVVTVFAAGFDSNSEVAALINGGGTEKYDCCPESYEPLDHFKASNTAAWTYLIHCGCPDAVDDRRNLRDISSTSAKFQRGELFDDELKTIYGL